ncbi:c-type cytochrome [Gluconobacter frateurii]|uniref:Cytochrome c-552 class I n=1 Tax=Gluconobacter frateurii NRIC 0228 TaxID=1307946 RepID=A0ABQ0QET5_9PROT|nr:cytochrome c [Gluconobacter frateurii]GBR16132.1 cytochrome c-552 class I [Gluconobacter frateurii NRIC 0228]GLP90492.1 cytochrome c-552 [Gluconobacter frateurii]
MFKFNAFLLTAALGAFSVAQAEDGLAIYNSRCSVCHQSAGIGSPSQFPPLSGRIGKIAGSPEGKTYLTHVLLNGLHGALEASDVSYMGYMPPFKSLTDAELAAVLTYVSSLNTPGTSPVFSADEFKVQRSKSMKANDILSEREALDALHPLP